MTRQVRHPPPRISICKSVVLSMGDREILANITSLLLLSIRDCRAIYHVQDRRLRDQIRDRGWQNATVRQEDAGGVHAEATCNY